MVPPPLQSVNQEPRKRVGSTLTFHSDEAARHQPRPRTCSASTEGCPLVQPAEGPAPTPTPQSRADHNTSGSACAAALRPPSLRFVPANIVSTPSRTLP